MFRGSKRHIVGLYEFSSIGDGDGDGEKITNLLMVTNVTKVMSKHY